MTARGCVVAALVLAAGCTASVTGGRGAVRGTAGPPNSSPAPAASSSPFVAAHAGRLPAAGRPVVAGVQLPLGRPVRPDIDGTGHPTGPPVMWATDDVLPDAGTTVMQLQAAFPSTGLWPLVLQANETQPDDGRPWRNGEFAPGEVTPVDTIAIGPTMARWWRENLHDYALPDTRVVLGGSFRGLHSAAGPRDDGLVEQRTAGLPGRIGLVAVTTPADAPARMGWLGATNYFDAGYVSAVLRSWQQRYGAVLVRIGFDYLEVALRHPLDSDALARRFVAEQFAFCPDQIAQGDYDTTLGYVRSLHDATEAYCWWD